MNILSGCCKQIKLVISVLDEALYPQNKQQMIEGLNTELIMFQDEEQKSAYKSDKQEGLCPTTENHCKSTLCWSPLYKLSIVC